MHKSDTMRILWKELVYIAAFSLLLEYVVMHFSEHHSVLEKLISVYSLVGFVISLLLVFRTNTAYDRWWEGRKKWGGLVNDTRTLAIKLESVVEDEETRDFFKRMIPNFAFAMKEHLREGVKLEELELTAEEHAILERKDHVPAAIVQMLYGRVEKLIREGKITRETSLVLDANLNALLDHLGACERIKNTPIPYSYMIFLKKFIVIYVGTMPLAFVSVFGYYSALISTFVFYVLVSMEVLAEEIEDPFGNDDNDLPTDGLSAKIRTNVREIFGRSEHLHIEET
jgi:putative membrane protein